MARLAFGLLHQYKDGWVPPKGIEERIRSGAVIVLKEIQEEVEEDEVFAFRI